MSTQNYTQVSSTSWMSRLSSSIKGVLFGLLIFIGAFILIWWNEGRAVKTAKGLTEGAAVVEHIESTNIKDRNEGTLIHLSDKVISKDTLRDLDFDIISTGLKLKRSVEMFQWAEESESKKEKNIGGSETTTTHYTYVRKWSSDLINSNSFNVKDQYINPSSFSYSEQIKTVTYSSIGAFDFSENFMGQMTNYSEIPLTPYQSKKESNIPDTILTSSYIFIGFGTAQNPQIGDVKITFSEVKEAMVSLIAKQSGMTFQPYLTESGSTIELLEYGNVSAEQMFVSAQSRNSFLTWVFRILGFFMFFFGIYTIFKPLVTVADVVPLFGKLLSSGLSLFAGIISFFLAFITIGISWVVYRPLVGGTLLLIGASIFGLFYVRSYKKKADKFNPTNPTP